VGSDQAEDWAVTPIDERDARILYEGILAAWNERDAAAMAACFARDGSVVGFDGSELNGRDAIREEMARIFRDHQTGRYVGVVRDVKLLSEAVAILRAVAGIVPHGQTELNPQLNAVQTLVAVKHHDHWRAALYHNTPAAFHGRPEAVKALTEELRQHLTSSG
jgi:uncharacterized protein (TIGR02246 family)